MHSSKMEIYCLPKFVSQDIVDTQGPKYYKVAFPFITFNISKFSNSKIRVSPQIQRARESVTIGVPEAMVSNETFIM